MKLSVVASSRPATRPAASAARQGGGAAGAGGLGGPAPAQHGFSGHSNMLHALSSGGSCTTRGFALYSAALRLARSEKYDPARRAFERTVAECPSFVKSWVSWAQMEKRCMCGSKGRYDSCRTVLQRGLEANRDSPALLQAWGLMEMQRGNWAAALLLLERSAALEPRNLPVLRWRPVVEARQAVGSLRHQRGGSGRVAQSNSG